MRAEILEQPDVLLELCRRAPGWRLPGKQPTAIVFFGSGSSFNAGLLGRFYFEAFRRLPCQVRFASEAFRGDVVYPSGTLAVALSHSGRSADVRGALRRARRLGLPTLAVTSVDETPLGREADLSVVTGAGREDAVPSTKGFTAMAAAALALASPDALPGIERASRALRTWLASSPGDPLAVETVASAKAVVFLGEGVLYPVARDGALKLLEVAYVPALAYPPEEFRHGPLALVDGEVAVVALEAGRRPSTALREARSAGARVVTLGAELPRLAGALRPLVFAPALQLLAHGVGRRLGVSIDQPRRLKKVVG